jgi:hypothetical protein
MMRRRIAHVGLPLEAVADAIGLVLSSLLNFCGRADSSAFDRAKAKGPARGIHTGLKGPAGEIGALS